MCLYLRILLSLRLFATFTRTLFLKSVKITYNKHQNTIDVLYYQAVTRYVLFIYLTFANIDNKK